MSFLVNDNGPATATNLPANSITAAMIAANAATTAKFASKSATFTKFANDAKAALIGPAAAALATLLAETAANRAGFVGGFYLADDFETDSLATKTNSTYDAASNYYHSPSLTTVTSAPAEWAGGTGDWDFTGGDLEVTANDNAVYSVDEFTGDFSFSFTYKTDELSVSFIGLMPAASKGSVVTTAITPQPFNVWGWSNHTSSNYLSQVTDGNFGSLYENGSQYDMSGVTDGQVVTFRRVGTAISCEVDGATVHTFSQTSSATLCLFMGQAMGSTGHFLNASWSVPATPSNQTLAPTPVTLATANPTDLIAFVVIDPQEAITVGTDIAMSMSVDGGTTDAIGSWTSLGYIGGANLELYAVEADVSAQTGSSLTYEITTANNKEIRLHQLVGIKAFY